MPAELPTPAFLAVERDGAVAILTFDRPAVLNAHTDPVRAEFSRIRAEQGVKAAITWRDVRFRESRRWRMHPVTRIAASGRDRARPHSWPI